MSWAPTSLSWRALGRSWPLLGRSWDALGILLGHSWDPLGRSWAHLGALGRSWDPHGILLARFRDLQESIWGPPELLQEASEQPKRTTCCQLQYLYFAKEMLTASLLDDVLPPQGALRELLWTL